MNKIPNEVNNKAPNEAPNKLSVPDALYQSISELIQQARQQVQRSVNSVMVQSYWHIGRLIIEHEQQGESRAAYGKQQLGHLSARLTDAFGKGFDVTNLRNMRRFYQAFPIQETVSLELNWSQYNRVGWARFCAHALMFGKRLACACKLISVIRCRMVVTRGHDNAVPTLQFCGVGV